VAQKLKPTQCGHNREDISFHADGQGRTFMDAFNNASLEFAKQYAIEDQNLNDYAAQLCPSLCLDKTPKDPVLNVQRLGIEDLVHRLRKEQPKSATVDNGKSLRREGLIIFLPLVSTDHL
jgi:hypothetical protein